MRYLCSFKPLVASKYGRTAVERFGLSPFVDGSCRREPDFESGFPSISALCRFRRYAPRLREGDTVVYMTTKGRYGQVQDSHWRLVAILDVLKRFESHETAAEWYKEKGIPLPRNCMVAGNPPLPFEKTNGILSGALKEQKDRVTTEELVRRWDARYRYRARKCGVFLVCQQRFLELDEPPVLTETTMYQIFGRIPGTQNPPRITESEFALIWEIARAFSRQDGPTLL